MTLDVLKLKNRLATAVAAIFAAISLSAVIYYIIYPSEKYFHADCSDTILWAQASYDSGTLFNKDFGYAAMLPFGGTMLMIPFIGIFGVSMTTHHIGMVLFTLLLFAAAFLLCRSLKFSLPTSLTAVGVFALVLCASEKMREIFYEHVIYYSISALIIFVLLSLLIKFNEAFEQAKPKKLIAVTLITVFFVACSALDGMQVIATGIVPVLFAAVAEILFSAEKKIISKENKATVHFCIVSGFAVIMGLLILSVFSEGIESGYANAYSQYANMEDWLTNLGNFPVHWFRLFGVDAHYGMSIFSGDSIINIIRIAAAALIALVPFVALIFYKKFDFASKLLILSHFGVAAVIMFGYVFGILSAANWRLSPMVCTGIFVCFAMLRVAKNNAVSLRISVIGLCVLILMSGISFMSIAQMEKNGIEENEKYKLARILDEKGLNYGYATFWNSQAITVLSDSKVRAANVDINENGIAPCRYQSNMDWFELQEGVDEYFVLASDYEVSILESTADQIYFDLFAQEVIQIDGYKIFVFKNVDFLK